jgi:hypothetical protein
MKYLVIVAFVLILGSLVSALVFMMKKSDSDPNRAKRMVNSLTVRISLSVLLFATILLAWYFGLIAPTGRP